MNNNILSLISAYADTHTSLKSPIPPLPTLPNNHHSTTSLSSSVKSKNENTSMTMICFSKNRPFQLQQTLASFTNNIECKMDRIIVIYSPGEWLDLYKKVIELNSAVVFIDESDGFCSSFQKSLDLSRESNFIMFCVDDLIFYSKTNIRSILTYMQSTETALCAQLKLTPGILYSHPASAVCLPPNITAIKSNENNYHLQFSISSSNKYDWNYPIDFCGGIYRVSDVEELWQTALKNVGELGCCNPNKLETQLNNAMSTVGLSRRRKFIVCPSESMLFVVTVNRVQNEYEVPIYQTDKDLAALNQYTATDVSLDMGRYASILSVSVHIGQLFLSNSIPIYPSIAQTLEVSVVMPVWNCAQWVYEAAASILQEDSLAYELIIIDDGSTDSTKEQLQRIVDTFGSSRNVRVLFSEHKGLIHALETGIDIAQAELICRMDADDISQPHRLSKQLNFLKNNPHINVIGCQALLLTSSHLTQLYLEYDLAMMPTHPVLVQWEMMFRCPLLHPSVMFRKNIIHTCGSYSSCIGTYAETIEDYDLWMRIAERFPNSMANLSDVALQLRLSASSKSSTQRMTMTSASQKLRCKLVSSLMSGNSFINHLDVSTNVIEKTLGFLSKPDDIENTVDFHLTIKFINCLYEQFSAQVIYKWSCLKEKDIILSILRETYLSRVLKLVKLGARKFGYTECSKYSSQSGYSESEFIKDSIFSNFCN